MSNASALDPILISFDTTKLLAIVDLIDELSLLTSDSLGARGDLLTLHSLAHRIINQGSDTPSCEAVEEMAEIAGDLRAELCYWADRLQKASKILDILAWVVPSDD